MTGLPTYLNRWLIAGVLFPLIFLNGWLTLRVLDYFQPLVTIFVLASLLSFILNYPVAFLQRRGFKRGYAVLMVCLVAFLLLLALGVTLIPILIEQLNEIGKLLPTWLDAAEEKLGLLEAWATSHRLPINISRVVSQLTDALPTELEAFTDHLVTLALDAIGSLSEALLTAVLTFYLLLDGDRIWRELFRRLPVSFGGRLQRSLQQNFQNYFIGQLAIAALLGFSVTLVFLAFQLHFALLLGLGVGVMALIPFGDVLSFGLVTLTVVSQDFWLGIKVLAAVVVVDQVIDQGVSPRLLGSFTGLRPIWIIVALLVGTRISGLLGLLTAVPLASFFKDAVDGFPLVTETEAIAPIPTTATSVSTSSQDARLVPPLVEDNGASTDPIANQSPPTS